MTTDKSKNFFRVSAEDFKKIPGSPIAYWADKTFFDQLSISDLLGVKSYIKTGMTTADNDLFLRFWHEVSFSCVGLGMISQEMASKSRKKWFPYNKGGGYRKWYGFNENVINWENNGFAIKNNLDKNGKRKASVRAEDCYFKPSITYSAVTSANFSARYSFAGALFDSGGSSIFASNDQLKIILSLLCSNMPSYFLPMYNDTINFQPGDIARIPLKDISNLSLSSNTDSAISYEKQDWDSYETSWDFQINPLCISPQERIEQLSCGIHSEERKKAVSLISERYLRLRQKWKQQTEEMRKLEIENNRIFIEAYGLQDELSPEVPWNEITLTCNPWYRYGKRPEDMDRLGNVFAMNMSEGKVMPTSKQEEDCPAGDFPFAAETEQRLLEDTIKEFISYAVGCMMGRYSLALPGLAIANQGESLVEFLEIHNEKLRWGIPQCSSDDMHDMYQKAVDVCGFIPDEDGVLPILDEEWFADDIVTQFKAFVASTFGKENLTANMDFIEAVLGKDIRKYFVKDFYKEHIQRYKKRPIYWLFSSPKGSFNALIYLHRYTPDTVSIVLNEYLRELMTKISTRIKHLIEENNRADISNADKTRNLKQIDKYTAQLAELEDYERDVIFPLAQQKIAIDLDDGVKVNYCKFGAALKKIPGLEAKEE